MKEIYRCETDRYTIAANTCNNNNQKIIIKTILIIFNSNFLILP